MFEIKEFIIVIITTIYDNQRSNHIPSSASRGQFSIDFAHMEVVDKCFKTPKRCYSCEIKTFTKSATAYRGTILKKTYNFCNKVCIFIILYFQRVT